MGTHTHALKSLQLRNKTAGHLLLEFSNFGYMWTSVDTNKIVASHIIYSMLEIEPFTEFLTVQKWREFVHPHDLFKLIQAEEYVLITGESTSVEYRLITNRGKNLYVNHHLQLSNGVNDLKLMSIIEDITEQKRGDVILDIMNEGFFELDDNFCFRRLNKHTEKFWNLHRDDILGKKIADVFPDLQETFFYKLIISAKSKKINLIEDVVSPVRNTWIRISVSPYNDGVIVVFYDIDDKKRAEEELIRLKDELAKKVTDRYYSLFNSIDQGFCIIEMIRDNNDKAVDFRFLEVNTAFEYQTGINNPVGKTMREIEPQHEQHRFQIYDEVAKTKKPIQFEQRVELLNRRWYEVYAFSIEGIQDTQVGVLFKNITERKEEEEQRAYLLRLSDTLRSLSDPVNIQRLVTQETMYYFRADRSYYCEIDGDIVTIRRDAHREGLHSVANVYSLNDMPLFKAASKAGQPIVVADVNTSNVTDDVLKQLCLSFGIISYINVPIIKNNEFVGIFCLTQSQVREWTDTEINLSAEIAERTWAAVERAKIEESLRKSEERLKQFNAALEQQVLERTGELIKQNNILTQAEELAQAGSWEYNLTTREFVWSDGMYELFNIKKSAMITPGIYLELALTEDQAVACEIVDAITEHVKPFEKTMRIRPGGTIKTIKIKGAPLKNAEGQIERVLGVDMDISQARQSEEKITGLNRTLYTLNKELNVLNSELKSFASIAANNYSETLRHLYINLEMIVTSDARNLSNSGRANLRRAQGAVQKMKLLAEDIKGYLVLYDTPMEKRLFEPDVVIEEVLSRLEKKTSEADVRIELNKLPWLSADPSLFSMLMWNLIDNSVKFRSSSRPLIIKIQSGQTGRMNSLPSATDDSYVVISITDNGSGFAQDNREKIFELFSKLHDKDHQKGSGIGLAICKKIMEMHGGFILADSRPDEGASFHCYFPANDNQ